MYKVILMGNNNMGKLAIVFKENGIDSVII